MDDNTLSLFAGIGALLLLASVTGRLLKWRAGPAPHAVIDNLNARINAWWVMVLVIGIAFLFGNLGVILLFYFVSFYALREFLTLTPTRRSDYPALVAVITDYVDMAPGRTIDYGYRPFGHDDFLTWEQLREMKDSGLIELASHTDNQHHGVQSNPQGNSTPAVITRAYDPATGRYLEHRQLRAHPTHKPTWDASYANELGRLCQGIGTLPGQPTTKRIPGTDTFTPIHFHDIPSDRRSDITYTKVVCEVRPQKSDPYRTRITIGGWYLHRLPRDGQTPPQQHSVYPGSGLCLL